MMMTTIIEEQKAICDKYGATFIEAPSFRMIAISKDFKADQLPINGLRHPLENTAGWFIWTGEYSEDDDFFVNMHVEHLKDQCPEILKYLGLSPGWRFLIADNYEDVRYDENLLDI